MAFKPSSYLASFTGVSTPELEQPLPELWTRQGSSSALRPIPELCLLPSSHLHFTAQHHLPLPLQHGSCVWQEKCPWAFSLCLHTHEHTCVNMNTHQQQHTDLAGDRAWGGSQPCFPSSHSPTANPARCPLASAVLSTAARAPCRCQVCSVAQSCSPAMQLLQALSPWSRQGAGAQQHQEALAAQSSFDGTQLLIQLLGGWQSCSHLPTWMRDPRAGSFPRAAPSGCCS